MRGASWIRWDGPRRPSLCHLLRARRSATTLAMLLAVALFARPADAQLFARPWLNWHTVHAGRFDVHYPTELASWAEFVAARLPSIDSAVTRLAVYSPARARRIAVAVPLELLK